MKLSRSIIILIVLSIMLSFSYIGMPPSDYNNWAEKNKESIEIEL